jgi:hypothetical protein
MVEHQRGRQGEHAEAEGHDHDHGNEIGSHSAHRGHKNGSGVTASSAFLTFVSMLALFC